MRRILTGLVLILMLPGGAAAGPYDDGMAAYQRGDYSTALRLWQPLAEQGDAQAQHGLAVLYIAGQGVPQNYVEGVKWFRLAAEQGIINAQGILGGMYARGRGVPQDYAEAVKWYRLAAEQGDALAQFNLGVTYENGQGVPQDYVQAHMWVNLAAATTGWDEAIEARKRIGASMTPQQIDEAQKLAHEWKPK